MTSNETLTSEVMVTMYEYSENLPSVFIFDTLSAKYSLTTACNTLWMSLWWQQLLERKSSLPSFRPSVRPSVRPVMGSTARMSYHIMDGSIWRWLRKKRYFHFINSKISFLLLAPKICYFPTSSVSANCKHLNKLKRFSVFFWHELRTSFWATDVDGLSGSWIKDNLWVRQRHADRQFKWVNGYIFSVCLQTFIDYTFRNSSPFCLPPKCEQSERTPHWFDVKAVKW